MYLETKRLYIRPFSIMDVQDVYEYCSQTEIGEFAGWCMHNSVEETMEVLKKWVSEGFFNAIVLKDNDKVIGHINIGLDSEENREDTRELGCALNKQYHRQGIMTECMKETLNSLFGAEQIQYVWACCFQNNIASRRMIEKCGFIFQQEGIYNMESRALEIPSYEYRISKNEWKQLK